MLLENPSMPPSLKGTARVIKRGPRGPNLKIIGWCWGGVWVAASAAEAEAAGL